MRNPACSQRLTPQSAAPTHGAGAMNAHAVPASLALAQYARRVLRRAASARQCD